MKVQPLVSDSKISCASISAVCSTVRPPAWPPPSDWVVSETLQGTPLSRWRDSYWDYSPWAGCTFKLDFAGGQNKRSAVALGPENQLVMRMLATWIIWGAQSAKSWHTLKTRFLWFRRIVALCESEGIAASNLYRFPRVLNQVPSLFPSKSEGENLVFLLDRLIRAKDQIGFTLVDVAGISSLAKSFADMEPEDVVQTAYIPPRIWTYQLNRLRECIDDFLEKQSQIEDCFNFCVDAYAHNFGSLEAALLKKTPTDDYLPFTEQMATTGKRSGRKYHGLFGLTAKRFDVYDLLKKWVEQPSRQDLDVRSLSAYLSLVQSVAYAYITNFTLQRKEESGSLRADCLIWEEDIHLGRIPIICGESTKTDPDSDARWPTSPSVEPAILAATAVANMRMRCAYANPLVNCTEADRESPFLLHTAFEPWSVTPNGWKPYSTRAKVGSYRALMRRFPRLFSPSELRITEDDLSRARMFTPNLDRGGKFKVGEIWPLCWHQLRRTGGINMFASGLLSDSSIQVIMKHLTLSQTLYYGRNYSQVRFSEDFEGVSTASRYEVMAKQIETLVEDRYVSPLGEQRKQEIAVNLVSYKNFKALVQAGRRGEVSFRETRLGGCTKNGPCEYGGIESVTRCSGGDGGKPCSEAIFDRTKQPSVERQLVSLERRLDSAQAGSPRQLGLMSEVQGLRNFLDVVQNHDG